MHGGEQTRQNLRLVDNNSFISLIAGKIIGDALDENEQRQLAIKYLSEVGSLNDD